MELKTWTDLAQAAIGRPWGQTADPLKIHGEPLLWQALKAVEVGLLTREQALIQVVFALVQTKNDLTDQLVEMRNRTPAIYFVPFKEP